VLQAALCNAVNVAAGDQRNRIDELTDVIHREPTIEGALDEHQATEVLSR